MNEFEEMLGKSKQTLRIEFSDARKLVERGLSYFIGGNYKWLSEYDYVVNWMYDNKQRGLLLYGANGRGKSILCKYILPTLFEYYYKRLQQYNVRAIDLRYSQPDSNEYYTMRRADILFIDDFGIESIMNNYGEKRDVFSDIVDIAEHERKLLICSTNLVPEEIAQRYGLRTLDRLKALTYPVCFEGTSMRGKLS